jgi:Protein of unknown function (DUF5672)
VIIPLHRRLATAAELYSFENTLSVLSAHDTFVVCPPRLESYLSRLRREKGWDFSSVNFPASCFDSVASYNALLVSPDFYICFSRYSYILIVQIDALVVSDRLDYWCDHDYSYIGAPWFRGMTRPAESLKFLGVGNGGFSLRKVADFLRVFSHLEQEPCGRGITTTAGEKIRFMRAIRHCLILSNSFPYLQLNVNEDIFWGLLAPWRYDFFKVPNAEQAVPFAFETAPRYLHKLNNGELPFGCHAWERYDPDFWREAFTSIGRPLPVESG